MKNSLTLLSLVEIKQHFLISEIVSKSGSNSERIRTFLKPIVPLYPNFNSWLNFTFIRQLDGEKRKIFLVKQANQLAGVSLVKRTLEENKICTFYVSPDCRKQGIGTALIEASLEFLDSAVNITVSEERDLELRGFLEAYGFGETSKKLGYYRNKKIEYFYTKA